MNNIVPHSNNLPSFTPKTEDEKLDFDLEYARGNILTLIETGTEGARQLADIADQSQNSLAYERLGNFLKTVSELNKDLITLGVQKKEMSKPLPNDDTKVTNNLFVGSTAEMAKLLANIKKEREE